MSFAAALGWLAAALSGSLSIPQVFRIIRTRSVAGLNLLTWQTLLIAGVSWSAHGILVDRAQILLPNAVMMLGGAIVLAQIQKAQALPTVAVWVFPLAASASSIALDYALGPVVFAVMMVVPAVIGQLAQYREIRNARDVSGISPAMLLINPVAQALWLTYALVTWELSIICVATVLIVVMTANVAALMVRRRQLSVQRRIGVIAAV